MRWRVFVLRAARAWVGGSDFYLSLRFLAGQLARASSNKHRRGPSTSRHKATLFCDRSAKRFAQEDDFVWGLRIPDPSTSLSGHDVLVCSSRALTGTLGVL